MKIRLTDSRPRRIASGVLALALVILLIAFPDTSWPAEGGVFAGATLFFPGFVLCACASLLLDFSAKQKRVRYLVMALAVAGCLLAIFSLGELSNGKQMWSLLFQNPGAFAFGLGIIFALAALCFAVIGSVPWALRTTTLLVALFSFVNYFALVFRGTPFIPQDFFGLATAADVASAYSLAFSRAIGEMLLVVIGVFIISCRLKFPKPQPLVGWLSRAGALVLAVVFFMVTVSKPFIVANNLEPFYFEQWQSAGANGTIVNFAANIADAYEEMPEGYSLEAVNQIASRFASDFAGDAKEKPDVIVILGESWADLVLEGRAETNKPVTPFMSSLANRDDATLGNLVVSSWGGGTSRQEFQFFTGANDEYGLHTAPFLFSVDEQLPSIVRSFDTMEYETVAIHTGTSTAWNRDTALPMMGFDAFYSEDDLFTEDVPRLRTTLRDSVLYDKALDILDDAKEPTFIYGITIHTHGGFSNEDYVSTIEITEPEGSFGQTEQYLSLLNEADKDLEAFIGALEDRTRPTLVLFFGDHLPNFSNSFEEEVLVDSSPFWKYKTLYGAWANFELPEDSLSNNEYLSLSYLNLYLMESAGLPLTGYQKFLLEGAREFPVASIVGYMNAEGEILTIEEAEQLPMYQEQALLQYNFVYDRGNMPSDFYTLREQ